MVEFHGDFLFVFWKSDLQNTFSVNELVSFTSCHNHTLMFLIEHTRRKAGKTDKLCKL